jgi:K+-transporting ATPase ATPase C chain
MRHPARSQLFASFRILVFMTLALGVAYPLGMTAVAQVAFENRADGSLVVIHGEVVGSSLIGQAFESPEYFHPRPSAAGYNGGASGGSNRGPTNDDLAAEVEARVGAYRTTNNLDESVRVPVDAVTASGSGLDPHISPANARLQAPRVAATRGIDLAVVMALVNEYVDQRPLGFLGDDVVNVLELNVALDATVTAET